MFQVAKIETEKMLIQMVETELEHRKQMGAYKDQFKGQSHFFGYYHLCLYPVIPLSVIGIIVDLIFGLRVIVELNQQFIFAERPSGGKKLCV